MPIGKTGFEEGLVRAPPVRPRGVEALDHVLVGAPVGPGDEDPGVHPVHVGEGLVQVGRRRQRRVAEQAVDVAHRDGVGVDEDDAFVLHEFPEPELDEVVEGIVEGRLDALGEG